MLSSPIIYVYEKSCASNSPNNRFVSFDPVRMMGSLGLDQPI